eukprot:403360357
MGSLYQPIFHALMLLNHNQVLTNPKYHNFDKKSNLDTILNFQDSQPPLLPQLHHFTMIQLRCFWAVSGKMI